jgi:hypothetical protein
LVPIREGGDEWQSALIPNKSFPLKNSSCPGSVAGGHYSVACGERNIQQRGVFGDGGGGKSWSRAGKELTETCMKENDLGSYYDEGVRIAFL